jgi:hypothetical protein
MLAGEDTYARRTLVAVSHEPAASPSYYVYSIPINRCTCYVKDEYAVSDEACRCTLFTTCCLLHALYYMLFTTCSLLHALYYMLFTTFLWYSCVCMHLQLSLDVFAAARHALAAVRHLTPRDISHRATSHTA